ncbi:MAG: sugar ABC transporter ATP-binding protein [Clostridiaceae bacterium]|jgi:ribose transport system ATP-binding protein|nr:sugar ABC transporter ATP-binding protein [Clostridiaceae bacterium]
MGDQVLLTVKKISKAFGPTRALIDVDMEIRRGEIRGLIGENGSGKSTLASIIAGAQFADSGSFELKGKPYAPRNMVGAQNHGVSMIIQEMGTIPGITVAANIFTGRLEEFTRFGFINMKAINRRAAELLQEIGAGDIHPETLINRLNFEERKIVEIARAMVANPDLLIVDETTTALAQRGRELLYRLIRRLHEENKSVLFISHDLHELMSICDTITVLRDGIVIDTLEKEEISVDRMRSLMVGRELSGSYFRSDYDGSYSDEVVLEAKRVTSGILEEFNLELHKGEILGVGGLSDCGMHELGRVLFGIDKPITGSVTLKKNNVQVKDPHVATKNNMAYVSKERDREAIILNASIKENVVLPSHRQLRKVLGLITRRSETNLTNKQIETLRIKCRNGKQICNELSGGNKQKVVFAKWLGKESDILILDCPTRGIDVGVKAAMYKLMTELKAQGKSIVMISEELPELIGMSDRILLLKNGRLQAELRRSPDISEKQIIQYII